MPADSDFVTSRDDCNANSTFHRFDLLARVFEVRLAHAIACLGNRRRQVGVERAHFRLENRTEIGGAHRRCTGTAASLCRKYRLRPRGGCCRQRVGASESSIRNRPTSVEFIAPNHAADYANGSVLLARPLNPVVAPSVSGPIQNNDPALVALG
jgi:hypothetical protein